VSSIAPSRAVCSRYVLVVRTLNNMRTVEQYRNLVTYRRLAAGKSSFDDIQHFRNNFLDICVRRAVIHDAAT
jgi:hypothetical protein